MSHDPSLQSPSPSPQGNRTSISAILSLILALMTLPGIFCCVGYGTGIVAIVLGVIALVQVKNGEANSTSKVLAIAGIVVSTLAMIGYSIALLIGVATMPDVPGDVIENNEIAPATSTATPTEEPTHSVTAAELVGAYEGNELAAEKKYEGQIVEVTGVVGDIKKDILDDAYVTLGTGKQFEVRQVQCFLANGVDATALAKGDQVTLTGRVEGLMMNVLVRDCR